MLRETSESWQPQSDDHIGTFSAQELTRILSQAAPSLLAGISMAAVPLTMNTA